MAPCCPPGHPCRCLPRKNSIRPAISPPTPAQTPGQSIDCTSPMPSESSCTWRPSQPTFGCLGRDEFADESSELDRLIALNRVAGAVDHFHAGVGQAAAESLLVTVI